MIDDYVGRIEAFPPMDEARSRDRAAAARGGNAKARREFMMAKLRLVPPIARLHAGLDRDGLPFVEKGNLALDACLNGWRAEAPGEIDDHLRAAVRRALASACGCGREEGCLGP